jgi:NADH/NAD ratio-sensing transcriptional regulator Rex
MQDKMAEKRAPPNTSNMPNENDIQFLSNGYDDLVKSKVDTQNDVLNLKKRLDLLSVGVNRIDKAIDLLTYSYQYNLKIVGVPQLDDKESSDETAVLCINFFRAMGVDISISNIDIAHRTPIRSTTNGCQSQTNPIVCKFVRRLARDKVLAARNNSSQLSVNDLKLPSMAKLDCILIFNHLTPRLQELLYEAKKTSSYSQI